MENAFITGSHAHGFPSEKSDIDLVILVNDKASLKLWKERDDSPAVRYGKLNLIVFTSKFLFDAWKSVNDDLVRIGPVSRDEAVRAYQAKGFNSSTYGTPESLKPSRKIKMREVEE